MNPDDPILNIIGDKVALGPLRRDLLPTYSRWKNDFAVMRTFDDLRPHSSEAVEAWYERATKNDQEVHFTVYERSTLRPVGYAELEDVDQIHHTAEFGLFIGDKESWNKGYGTEATRLVLEYAFTGLALHSVWLSVDSYNEAAIRAYTRVGFKLIGRQREVIRWGGRWYDSILMDCLSTEFEGTALRHLMPDG